MSTEPAGLRTSLGPDARSCVDESWHALDRAQLALAQECRRTGDQAVASFRDRFEAASDAVLALVMTELHPEAAENSVGRQSSPE